MYETFRRYALYWTPAPGSALAEAGADWFGWDPAGARGEARDDPRVAAPWRYGLHATLKAPFRLTAGIGLDALDAAAADFAREHGPVRLAPLVLDDALGFFALRPAAPCPALDRLAAAVVQDFDRFRAPLDAAERARRHPEAMTPRARALFERWGYPHVMEAFRFHVSLTGRVPAEEAEATRAQLTARFGWFLSEGIAIDALSLMGDPAPDAAGHPRGFVTLARHPLTGSG